MLFCIFCNKECNNKNSQSNHQRRCPSNPDRIFISYKLGKKGGNQYTKGTAKPLTEEQLKKRSEAAKRKVWTEEMRVRHSIAMKKAVEKYPESYTSSNRGRTKQIIVDGIKFQGKWELEFYQYCKDNDLVIERSNEWFEYEWNGRRRYFPDFYLPELDLYIEVKGYETERDRAKWKHFPKRLKVIRRDDIIDIRKGCFGGL